MQVILHIEQIIMLEITECVEVKIDEDGNFLIPNSGYKKEVHKSRFAEHGERYCTFTHSCAVSRLAVGFVLMSRFAERDVYKG